MGADTLRGAALLQRGTEDLVAIARGTTGAAPDTKCSLGTRFQISSVTKQFTAAAVLLLADRGVLSVPDPISRWLDGCPAAWDQVTVHHLLSHSAGLVHWTGLPGLDVTKPATTSKMLRIFAAAALLSPPGTALLLQQPGVRAARSHPRASHRAALRRISRPGDIRAAGDGRHV